MRIPNFVPRETGSDFRISSMPTNDHLSNSVTIHYALITFLDGVTKGIKFIIIENLWWWTLRHLVILCLTSGNKEQTGDNKSFCSALSVTLY